MNAFERPVDGEIDIEQRITDVWQNLTKVKGEGAHEAAQVACIAFRMALENTEPAKWPEGERLYAGELMATLICCLVGSIGAQKTEEYVQRLLIEFGCP